MSFEVGDIIERGDDRGRHWRVYHVDGRFTWIRHANSVDGEIGGFCIAPSKIEEYSLVRREAPARKKLGRLLEL